MRIAIDFGREVSLLYIHFIYDGHFLLICWIYWLLFQICAYTRILVWEQITADCRLDHVILLKVFLLFYIYFFSDGHSSFHIGNSLHVGPIYVRNCTFGHYKDTNLFLEPDLHSFHVRWTFFLCWIFMFLCSRLAPTQQF